MASHHSSHMFFSPDQQDINFKHVLKFDQSSSKVSLADIFSEKIRISESIFDLIHKNESIWNNEELEELYLNNTNEIYRLIKICLEPKKTHISNNLYPNLAKQMLRRYPRLLIKIMKQQETQALSALLEFLKTENKLNPTVLGYFGTITNEIFYDFQQILASALLNNQKQLDLCLKNINYFEIFMFLINVVFFSEQRNSTWKLTILQHLFTSVVNKNKHSQKDHFKFIISNANESLEYIMQYSVIKTEQHKNLLSKLFTLQYLDSLFETLSSKQTLAVDLQYSRQIILLVFKISQLYLEKRNEPDQAGQDKPILSDSFNSVEATYINIVRLALIIRELMQGEKTQEYGQTKKEGNKQVSLSKTVKLANGDKIKGFGTFLIHYLELVHLYVKDYKCQTEICASILDISQVLYTCNPWNSILHCQLTKLLEIVISEIRRFIGDESFKSSLRQFIEFLIGSFKNKEYIFLTTCNVIFYGYSENLFKISKLLAEQTYLSQEFQTLLHSFPKWEEFIVKDIMSYGKEIPLAGNKTFLEYVKKMSNESNLSKEKEKLKSNEKQSEETEEAEKQDERQIEEIDSPTPRFAKKASNLLKVPTESTPFEYFALYSGSPIAEKDEKEPERKSQSKKDKQNQ